MGVVNHPLRVNKYKDPWDVVITRATKWGNIFVVGVHGTRDECVDQFAAWVVHQPSLMNSLHELRGKRLGCVCKPTERCHGDVLATLANERE